MHTKLCWIDLRQSINARMVRASHTVGRGTRVLGCVGCVFVGVEVCEQEKGGVE